MKKLLSVSIILAVCVLSAKELFTLPAPQDYNSPQRLKVVGNGILEAVASGWFLSVKRTEVDPSLNYRIRGEFRAAPGKTVKGQFCLGFYGVDKHNQIIQVSNVNVTPGSETELAAPVRASDTVIRIRDGSKWKKQGYLAYDIDPSGRLRDLPCQTMINLLSSDVRKNGDVYEVCFSRPAGKNLAAGIPVRQHLSGWSFLTSDRRVPTAEWQTVSWTVKPGAVRKNTRSQWLYGTEKFVAVIVAPSGTQFRNITVETEEK